MVLHFSQQAPSNQSLRNHLLLLVYQLFAVGANKAFGEIIMVTLSLNVTA
jgi:hypothetical protein